MDIWGKIVPKRVISQFKGKNVSIFKEQQETQNNWSDMS